ncbi:hypothetical protein [Planktotalea sp.]|uniref:hypothetical protein n=1 Tax=Planktotalea sp. TaxID=2029877 RepID=UPI003D6B3A91
MPKVSEDVRKAFGKAVKRARSLKPWTLDELGAAMEPSAGKSFISKVEGGTKEALDTRTVGRFIKALSLDEEWIDKFLDVEATDEADETKAERDADRIVARLAKEGLTAGKSDELLFQLAITYAEGKTRDLETAYVAVKKALEIFERMQAAGEVADNADGQYQGLMAEVARLNLLGDMDGAALALDDAMARNEQAREKLFQDQLGQDRIRNRPDLAAKRLIADLHRQAPPGGVFGATNQLCTDWMNDGYRSGDMFKLRVALDLAKANYEKAKGKRGLEALALDALGASHFYIAQRSSNERHLTIAQNALEGAIKRTSKSKEPNSWARAMVMIGTVLLEMGIRDGDASILGNAVVALRDVVDVGVLLDNSVVLRNGWGTLGNALAKLGEVTKDAQTLREAVESLETALAFVSKTKAPLDWKTAQNNLGLAQRYFGDVTDDLSVLVIARDTYASCEALGYQKEAPFSWAVLQWNIADLALARYRLDPDPAHLKDARERVTQARAFFVDGSDYQTERCDDLLAKIDAAEAA